MGTSVGGGDGRRKLVLADAFIGMDDRRMNTSGEWSEAIDQAFTIALMLSGDIEAAEAAVLDGISICSQDRPGADLLSGTVISAIRKNVAHPREHAGVLPFELQAVTQMAGLRRNCFVLRVLAGLPLSECSRLLDLPVEQVEDAVCSGYQELSRLETHNTAQLGVLP